VHEGDRGGCFVFDAGKLQHARYGALLGESAAMEMLCWPRPYLVVRSEPNPQPRNVVMRLSQLLLEAYRLFDERGQLSRGGHAPRAPAAPGREQGDAGDDSDAASLVPSCTAAELVELAPDLVHGFVISRRTGRILLSAGEAFAGDAGHFGRALALAQVAASFATEPDILAEMVTTAGTRSTLVWPSLRVPATLIVLVMKRSSTAFALAAQRLRLRGL